MPPPAKRLRSSGPIVSQTRPPVEQLDVDDDGASSSDEGIFELENDNGPESDFSDDELDISYQLHEFPRSHNNLNFKENRAADSIYPKRRLLNFS